MPGRPGDRSVRPRRYLPLAAAVAVATAGAVGVGVLGGDGARTSMEASGGAEEASREDAEQCTPATEATTGDRTERPARDSRSELTNAGEFVEGTEFRPDEGVLHVRAEGATLRDVTVRGQIVVSADDVTIEHVTAYGVAISGASGVTVRNTDLHGFSGADDQPDAVHITSDSGRVEDVLLEHNYIHDPRPAPDAHFDGTQVRGVDGLTIRCSTYDLGPFRPMLNAAIFFEDVQGGNSDVRIEGNVLDGGGYALRLHADPLVVSGNRFGSAHGFGLCTRGTDLEADGNRDAGGRPVSLTAECPSV